MKMKRISAANIKDAMVLARDVLGEDAVLLDTKKTPEGVIVTFAIDAEDEPLFGTHAAAANLFSPPPTPAPIPSRPAPVARKMVFPQAKPTKPPAPPEHPALGLIQEAIRYHHIPEGFSLRLLGALKDIPAPAITDTLDAAEEWLAQGLAATVRINGIATRAKSAPTRGIMLVGAHGAGKTATIAKLATELTLAKKHVLLVSTDNERLGAAETLHTLAGVLKCEFTVCEKRATLKTLIQAAQGKVWVLIDSTGANIYDFAQLKALGEFAGLNAVEPILTCAAGMDAGEAAEMARVFNFLNIERMIVTRLDAVRRLGSMFAAMHAGDYALASATDSAVPTDPCQPINANMLAGLMLRHLRERRSH